MRQQSVLVTVALAPLYWTTHAAGALRLSQSGVMKGQNYWSESRHGHANLLKGTLTVFAERKGTVNHSLPAQMISSDLQHPTTPSILMSVLISMLILSFAAMYGQLEV